MKIIEENNILEIINNINENKIIILPTDTQIAVICKDENKIYKLKKRTKNKKLIKFIYSYKDKNFSNKFISLADNFWPGALTIIENKISYRMPNNILLINILKEIDFIYSSSANISGEEPLLNTIKYIELFKDNSLKNEIVIIKGISKESTPSSIYDLDEMKLIREGKISLLEIERVIFKKNI
ncbi:MAG: L-threonylcarbamoyladenylate synthase [Mycoplasmoidaceae bacterium]